MADTVYMKIEAEKAKKSFQLMQERVKNPRYAMNVIAVIGWKDVLDHFAKEEGSYRKWPDISETTKRRKQKTRILVDHGLLRWSTLYRTNSKEAIIYNKTQYADYHQHQHKKYNLEQRDFLWLSEKAKKLIYKYILKFFIEGSTA